MPAHQMSLLDWTAPVYPRAPGWKSEGTSRDAAKAMTPVAGTLRDRVLQSIKAQPGTADEIATRLGITPFACRPRCAELHKLNLIEKTEERRRNESKMTASVWRAVG